MIVYHQLAVCDCGMTGNREIVLQGLSDSTLREPLELFDGNVPSDCKTMKFSILQYILYFSKDFPPGAFLCGFTWVLSGYSGFLPPPKTMHVRLIGVSKIVSKSECEQVCGCLSRLSLCGPVMDWRPVQGVPRLSPDDRWDWLQPPRDPTFGLNGYRKWMDFSIFKQN